MVIKTITVPNAFIKTLHLTDRADPHALISLSRDDARRLERISNPHRKLIFGGVRLLASQMGIEEIRYHANGKPYSNHKKVSISHSGDLIGLMVSDRECGLDIERIAERILKIKDRFLDAEELSLGQEDLKKLTIFWAAKEAIFKKWGGDTVFFKKNQKIIRLDEQNKRVTLDFKLGEVNQTESLSYVETSGDFILVHTV